MHFIAALMTGWEHETTVAQLHLVAKKWSKMYITLEYASTAAPRYSLLTILNLNVFLCM